MLMARLQLQNRWGQSEGGDRTVSRACASRASRSFLLASLPPSLGLEALLFFQAAAGAAGVRILEVKPPSTGSSIDIANSSPVSVKDI